MYDADSPTLMKRQRMPEMENSRQERISKILDLYFARISDGSISPELDASVRLWFKEKENVPEKYTALREAFEKWVVYNDAPSGRAIASCIATMRKLNLPVSEKRFIKRSLRPLKAKHSARTLRFRHIASRVAAVMIPVMAALGVYTFSSLSAPDMIVERVPAGVSMRNLQLPDGTDVWMRSGSRLEYPVRFGRERSVDVSGEIFFDVAHIDRSSFVVDADDVKIRVKGTVFDCSAHPGGETTVTLYEGSVNVKADDGWVAVEPGEQFRYDAATGTSTTGKVDLDALDWRTGELDFTDMTLGEIFDRISKAYGIEVEIDAPLSGGLYMASFFSHEELSVVLSVLRDISGEFDYEITPDKIIIKKPSK